MRFGVVDVELDVPPGWTTHEREVREVPSVVLLPPNHPPWDGTQPPSVAFLVARIASAQSFGKMVRGEMRRRVPQGYPEVLPAVAIGGRRALGLRYTNGIHDIASWFLSIVVGHVHLVEAWALHRDIAEGTTPGAPELGVSLARGLRWTA